MIYRVLATFFATTSYSVLFHVPKNQIVFCGVIGSIGWLLYEICLCFLEGPAIPTLAAAVIITILCRMMSFHRKMPITVFLIASILPMVPGAGIYYTMYHTLRNDTALAALKGIETFKIAGAIAIGIILILSMPASLFHFPKTRKIN